MHCVQFDYQFCTFIFKFFQTQRNLKHILKKELTVHRIMNYIDSYVLVNIKL